MNQHYLSLAKLINYIATQRLAINIEMRSVDSILADLFTSHTIFAQPLEDSISPNVKHEIMQQRNVILKKVKNYIDNLLNQSKKTFVDKAKDEYEEL